MSSRKMSPGMTSAIGALLVAIGPVSMALYTPAMPELVHAFGTSSSLIKLSLSLYFAGFAGAQLLSGPVSDAFGRRKAGMVFLSIYLAGSVLSAFAPTVGVLLAGRLIQGIGASVGVTVSRAIVRDQFVGPDAARILNLIGIILSVGPAVGPTLGGFILQILGWRAIFFAMVCFGLAAVATVAFIMPETAKPDRNLIKPARLAKAYSTLVGDPRVLFSALVLGGSVGALYAQSTMLPFVLIDRVGLSPMQFGMGMLMQTGFYFLGSVALRMLSHRLPSGMALKIGLTLAGTGGLAMFLSTHLIAPSFLSIMGPVAVCSVGMAFLIPDITTAGLSPYPQYAGTASALMGFVQMGGGFVGGLVASMLGDPLTAFGTIIPTMQWLGVCSYFAFLWAWKRNPAEAEMA